MLREQKTQGPTERSVERSRQKLAGVLERTITLDSVPVSALYSNIVLDLVQHLDRPAGTGDEPSLRVPQDTAEWASEVPLVVDEVGVDRHSLVGAPFSR